LIIIYSFGPAEITNLSQYNTQENWQQQAVAIVVAIVACLQRNSIQSRVTNVTACNRCKKQKNCFSWKTEGIYIFDKKDFLHLTDFQIFLLVS